MLFTKENKNKGFTLVEVVVSVVVSSIVILSIALYTGIGIRQFRNSRVETTAIEEMQVVENLLRDKIKLAKDYKVFESIDFYSLELLCTDGTDDSLTTYNYAFIFIPSKHDLYFYNNGEKEALSIDYGSLNNNDLRRTGLLSDYVTHFEVDPSTKTFAIDKIVTADITVTVDRSVFSQTLKIRLRNR